MKAGTAWLVAFQCPLRRLSSYGKADLQRRWRSSWNQKRWQRADCWQGDPVTSNCRCSQLFKKSCCDQDNEKKRAAALKGQPVSRTRIKPVAGESGTDDRGEQCFQWCSQHWCHYVGIQTRLAILIHCMTVWDKVMFHLHPSYRSLCCLISFQFLSPHLYPWLNQFEHINISNHISLPSGFVHTSFIVVSLRYHVHILN